VVESRSKETANYVKRVAEYAYYLARKWGMDELESITLKYASPLHDVGKIGIPDEVLLKPTRLNDEEFEIIKSHATIGYKILKNSKRPVLKAAAVIAHEHHEKFDGTGYPRGLKEHDIHIYGRIIAIVDVFDALMNRRSYKEPWALQDAVNYMKEHKGSHFDPILVDLFLSDLDYIHHVIKTYAEE
jgi:putative two-component system response regulator